MKFVEDPLHCLALETIQPHIDVARLAHLFGPLKHHVRFPTVPAGLHPPFAAPLGDCLRWLGQRLLSSSGTCLGLFVRGFLTLDALCHVVERPADESEISHAANAIEISTSLS